MTAARTEGKVMNDKKAKIHVASSGRAKRLFVNPAVSIVYWIIILAAIWELGASAVEDRNHPEYILPHITQIVSSVFSAEPVSNGMTALQVVLTSAGDTLLRAGIGFLIGMSAGFALALLMHLCGAIEKLAFPYLMIIQMIPILGMAPIVLAVTGDIGSSRIVIAAILTFYPVATNTLAGLKSAEREKYDLMAMCSATKFQIYLKTPDPLRASVFLHGT